MSQPTSPWMRAGQAAVVLGVTALTILTTDGVLRTVFIVLLVGVAVIGGISLGMLALLPRFLAGQFDKAAREMTTDQLRHRLLEHPYFHTRGDGRVLSDVGQVRTALRQIRHGQAHSALDKMLSAYGGIAPFFAGAERVIGIADAFALHSDEVTALLEELARRDGPQAS